MHPPSFRLREEGGRGMESDGPSRGQEFLRRKGVLPGARVRPGRGVSALHPPTPSSRVREEGERRRRRGREEGEFSSPFLSLARGRGQGDGERRPLAGSRVS